MSIPKPKVGPRHRNLAAETRHPSMSVIAAFSTKLAKHLALIAGLTIAGSATGRVVISQLAIFCLVAAAAVAYSIGQSMKRRAPLPGRVPMQQP
jgi:hypothetical protein